MERGSKVVLTSEYSVSQLGKITFAKNFGPVPRRKSGYRDYKSWSISHDSLILTCLPRLRVYLRQKYPALVS